jgi:hypothetical protein
MNNILNVLSPVSCDGGRWEWMGCVSSLVHTNLLIVWDILEDFATTSTTVLNTKRTRTTT